MPATIFRLLVLIVLAFLISCAPTPKEKLPQLAWPTPPQKPRVRFDDLIVGSLDVTGTKLSPFSRFLFGEEGETRFIKPLFSAYNNGVLYVTDLSRIHILDFMRKRATYLGGGFFRIPTGIAVAANGDIYVGDSARGGIYYIKANSTRAIIIAGADYMSGPAGMAVDDLHGRLVVSDIRSHTLTVFSLRGEILFTIGGRGSKPGQFNYPYDVTIDDKGNIYVVDSGNFRIQIFDKDGKFVRQFGKVGTAPGQFARPKGIALDSDGHIYVVDAAFGNFQIFTKEGTVLLAVGITGTDPGQFQLPIDIEVDDYDNIYVVDQLNRRVQVFNYIKYGPDGQEIVREKPPWEVEAEDEAEGAEDEAEEKVEEEEGDNGKSDVK